MNANSVPQPGPTARLDLGVVAALHRLARRIITGISIASTLALPAHAVVMDPPNAGFEYFFSTSSLSISSTGDLDLSGLSFIEGVSGGFRVGASFALDWLVEGASALSSNPASSWTGSNVAPRSLLIESGGHLNLGSASLTLPGGTIGLIAQTGITLGNGATVGVGGTVEPLPASGAILIGPRGDLRILSGGDVRIVGGGNIDIVGGSLILSPVPEPSAAMTMLFGSLLLMTLAVRRRYPPKF